MLSETINYSCHGKNFVGFLAAPDNANINKKPAILIAHPWRGQNAFCQEKAKALAELGYVAFAADVFGDGQTAQNDDEAAKLMLPLFLDRKELRQRIVAAYDVVKNHRLVDPSSIGAIGFCFGGLTVIELLKSGVDIRGVVSFHGLLGNTLGEYIAQPAPLNKIKGALLILHGNDDPFVSEVDIANVRNDFTKAGVDWQINIYGHAMHAFTNPEAHEPKSGMQFNAKAEKRSWKAMLNFFSEIFKKV